MIDLHVLGPARVTVDGDPPPPELMWKKHLALLVYLAMAPDRREGRSRLAGLLWGDKPEKAARGSLAEALRVIRSCVDDGLEDAGAGYVRLAEGAVETDAERFVALMAAGDAVAAAELVEGEFMAGLAVPDAWDFEEWLAGQRRTWRARSEQALVAAADSTLAAGDPATAHDLAQRALALAPTSEAACRASMRCLCLQGDRGRALELFDTFTARLEEDLGIEPGDEMVAFAEQVRAQRSWRLPADRVAREGRGAESRRAPLVGRAEQLGALVRAWEACRDRGSLRVAILAGDLGTGRSRLLEELVARARLDGGAVAMVRAVPADRGSEGAVLDALADAAGLDPGTRGPALVDAIRATAADRPLVLAVDDSDRADDASLHELERIASRAADVPVMLLLVTGRSQDRDPLVRMAAELGDEASGVLVRVDRLDADALGQLAAWAVPDYDERAVERLTRRIAADTGGHPLLAVELLHGVAHGLAPEPDSGAWPESGRTLDQTRPGDLSGTLIAAIRVGFRVLTQDAQRVLAAASVLDPPVTRERLSAATALEGEALSEALDELEWEHWLAADARGYGFVAPLVREVVSRDMVTEGQRRRILTASG